jgi:magnesium chelatase family protein
LERREVVIARAGGVARYPAAVQLVLAANPCPCASPAGDSACVCSPAVRRRYISRISGPLLDRIDIQVELFPVRAMALLGDPTAVETTAVVAKRVREARGAAADRWRPHGWRTNSEIPGAALRGSYRLPRGVTAAIDAELERGLLSARGHTRVQRLAWSLADLGGRCSPATDDINEAMFLRTRRAV